MPTKKTATTPQVETATPEIAVAKTAKSPAKKAATPTVETTTPEIAGVASTQKASTKKATTKVTFTLPKEAVQTATAVALVGEFNNWDILNGVALKKQKDGSFSTTIELPAGTEYQYRFLINGEVWENAWDAPKYVETPFGTFNSVVLA